MMVPGARLLFWMAGAVLPALALAASGPQAARAAAALAGGLLALAALDAALSRRRLEGVGVEMPELVRLSQNRSAAIEVRIRNPAGRLRRLRLGLAFPPEIRSPVDDLVADLPSGAPLAKLSWPCTPAQRGSFRLERCFLETPSLLGFWDVRRAVSAASEIRVYPDLLAESRVVAALFLHHGGPGIHAQRQIGKGREFDKLRDYIPGDSYDDIHWKATAKRGRPVTKVFQIERTQEVYVVIDASRLSARAGGAPPAPALERFVTAALVLALAAERQGDLFGLLAFNDAVRRFVRARGGEAHFDACREALCTLHPRVVAPDFDELMSFIRLRLRRRALLVFLTDLGDPVLAESFVKGVEMIGRQHLVLVGMLRPDGVEPLFSEAGVESSDDLYRRLAGHIVWQNLRGLERILSLRGATLSLLERESLCADLVSRYMSLKQRQAL